MGAGRAARPRRAPTAGWSTCSVGATCCGCWSRKEIQARYSGSFLGLFWSYVQPAVRFAMYFFVIGMIIGLHRNVE